MNITEAKVEIERALRAFKAFEHADKVLGALELATNRQAELDREIAKLAKQRDEMLDRSRADSEAIAQRLDQAQAKAEAAEAEAEKAGAATLAEVEERAARIIAEAHEQAAQIGEQVAAAEAELARLDEEATAKLALLAELETKLEKVRANARQLLG